MENEEYFEVGDSRFPISWVQPHDVELPLHFQPRRKAGVDVSMSWISGTWTGVFYASDFFVSEVFISVLTSLAYARPDVIHGLLPNKRVHLEADFALSESRHRNSANSIVKKDYVARLWLDGKWRYLELSDKLPCRLNGQLLSSFAMCPNKKFVPWISFIEKAFAAGFDGFGSLRNLGFASIMR